MKKVPRLVVDTNVLIAGLMSKSGASFALLREAGHLWKLCLSVPLALEYESVALRPEIVGRIGGGKTTVETILSYLFDQAEQHLIYYLWRPQLNDPKDEMVLEVAITSRCDYLITFNRKDFGLVARNWGIRVVTPDEILHFLNRETEDTK